MIVQSAAAPSYDEADETQMVESSLTDKVVLAYRSKGDSWSFDARLLQNFEARSRGSPKSLLCKHVIVLQSV